MLKRLTALGTAVTLSVMMSTTAEASVSASEASKLKSTLTPLGGEKAGNGKSGWQGIPAWSGGLTSGPSDYKPPMHHPNPFPTDRPLVVINNANMQQYADMIPEGVRAMLKAYPQTFYLNVYQSRRTAAVPSWVADNTYKCATTADVKDWGFSGCVGGTPFPIPSGTNSQQALQIVWNHIARYRGQYVIRRASEVAVQRNGSYSVATNDQEVDFKFYHRDIKSPAQLNNIMFYFLSMQLAPARLAGGAVLVWETLDQRKEERQAWGYNAGQRRVRQAPNLAYDTPIAAADGLRTADDTDMYNGAPDKYEWKLIGKKEMLVPYNNFEMSNPSVKYKDLLTPGHMNSKYQRWEMHRVWIVEGSLLPGERHIYSKRRFYVDEDSWQILAADQYDSRGDLWRVSLAYAKCYWELPTIWSTTDAFYDLQAHRYHAMGLTNEEPFEFDATKPSPGDEYFTPAALRRRGTR